LYECPDFFELPVDGDQAKKKWVLLGANSAYSIGTFDGERFSSENVNLPGHRGQGFYAPQTFSDIPAKDGRRIQIGWFQTETRGMPFNQSMTIPLELKLVSTPDGPRMTYTPVRELEVLRRKSHRIASLSLNPGDANPLSGVTGELLELRTEFEPGEAKEVVFNVRGATIVWDAKTQELVVNGHRAPAPLRQGKQRLTIYCDRTGLEVFASDGLCYVPKPFIPKTDSLNTHVSATGGQVKFLYLEVRELASAWGKATVVEPRRGVPANPINQNK
jgi:sucrose-6-phosphate hydrolase SacC (GH32 family)